MNERALENPAQFEPVYHLSEIIKKRVVLNGKKIGELADVVAQETGKVPEVTHFVVKRPFGDPTLLIPWAKVKSMMDDDIVVDLEKIEPYQGIPGDNVLLLKDHILDKKVLDIEDHEVEVAYDIRMVMRNGMLYVSDVDFSRYGFLRRMGLKRVADYIYRLAFMAGAKNIGASKPDILSRLLIPLANKIKDRRLSWVYIQPLPTGLTGFKGDVKLNVLKERLADIPTVDLADILEEMDHEQRVAIFDKLDTQQASDTLEEIDPNVQRALVSSLKVDKVAQLIDEMTPAQGADVLSVLPWNEVKEILDLLKKENAEKPQSIIQTQEEEILNYATSNIIKLSPDLTIGQVQDDFKRIAKGKDVVMYLYIVDAEEKLLGIIDIKELLQAKEESLLKDIMVDHVISLDPQSTLHEASTLFQRYGFRAIPIIDPANKFLGVIPFRDVMKLKHRFLE